MSNELLGTLVGGTIGVLGTIVGTIITQKGTKIVKETELRQKEYQAKRDILTDVYKSLITIINLYPDESPNDIINHISYPPNYSLERYEAIFDTLDIKLKDYKNQLSSPAINLNYQRKSDIEVEISNIAYAKKKLVENRDSYYKAVKEYDSFVSLDKTVFDLYAGQHVKNCLVKFEVAIHNVFISGRGVGDPDDPNSNIIKIYRRELINAMRTDIGIL